MEFEAEHEGLTASWVAPAPQGGKGAEGRAGVADEAGHGKTEAECAEDGEKCGDAEMSALDRVQRDHGDKHTESTSRKRIEAKYMDLLVEAERENKNLRKKYNIILDVSTKILVFGTCIMFATGTLIGKGTKIQVPVCNSTNLALAFLAGFLTRHV
ncbi:RLORF14 [Gallid alphaherpesvirus 2]|uniref:Phosphoprotein pp24 n=3 Tax=Gallid alphaherpesvirus 2 TaxID=10390 RepID=PP24_GAHVM|nr:protein pp24 [Gallid alphaherpesvirus 2]Q77MT0.1 RecName: Full=Phosphoprotein pp24 [Marek's disease herpesvirus type 1 strain MD5]ACF49589.1 RLORF14 [synthetic construct]AEV54976.1 RLORF14 [Gallid herpesvirus 2 strain 814]AAG14188.1 24kD phosphoprotein pp24 [Gallid alphaherpesvirus 2]AAS01634.1 pp24 [Gallid alphaherpesvirus 2]ABF72222.1 pp24 [Gallid alphaherpesvirus 2]